MFWKHVSAATGISIGLVGLTVTLLLLAQPVGLVPDRAGAILDGRKSLCEVIAFDWALAARKGDLPAIKASADAVVKRNPNTLSIALRSADGRLLVEAGDHKAHWQTLPGGRSTTTQAIVPLFSAPDQKQWGQVEIRFRPLDGGNPLYSIGIPILGVALFLAGLGSLVYHIYVGRALRRLDRSTVVPERVKVALNVMSEGVLLLDDKEIIVLANDVFAGVLGMSASELSGKRVAGLPWQKLNSAEESADRPWTETLRDGQTRRDMRLELRTQSGSVRSYVVNAAPILGSGTRPMGVLVTFDDVSETEQRNAQLRDMLKLLQESQEQIDRQNKELQKLASRDSLTGCLNCQAFVESAQGAWGAAKR